MKCVEVEKQFDSFIDGEISGFYKKQIENHLEDCHSCSGQLEKLKVVSRLVKNNLPVVAPNQLDARVMEAFNQHHNKQQKQSKSDGIWAAMFGQLVIPKPILAFSLLTFAVITGLAFQLGRMTSANNQTQSNQIVENKSENESEPRVREIVQTKIVEIPVTKFVKVPVIQEKIVTQTIYKNIDNDKNRLAKDNLVNPNKSAPDNAINSKFLPQISLKDYQPLPEIKMTVIKKGESYNE